MKRTGWILAVLVVLAAGAAAAGEKFGVPVYPGAKYDEAITRAVKEAMQIDAACYRTNDPVAMVAEFYRTQGLKSVGKVTAEAGFFQKGKVDVTLQNPWMDLKTGAMMKDTLVTIVRNKF